VLAEGLGAVTLCARLLLLADPVVVDVACRLLLVVLIIGIMFCVVPVGGWKRTVIGLPSKVSDLLTWSLCANQVGMYSKIFCDLIFYVYFHVS
jgi:hypothetical protein